MKEGHRINQSVEKRIDSLEGLIDKKQFALNNAPKGSLRSTIIQGKERYYHYTILIILLLILSFQNYQKYLNNFFLVF